METLLRDHMPGMDVDDEEQIERLLSEKLLDGYVLLEASCPACATPLVKRHEPAPAAKDEQEISRVDSKGNPTQTPMMVPSQSFDQPFEPVQGVPFCVGCSAHVVTDEAEISLLERCDSLKVKGSILVALDGGSTVADQTVFDQSESQSVMQAKRTEHKPQSKFTPTVATEPMEESPQREDVDAVDKVADNNHGQGYNGGVEVTNTEFRTTNSIEEHKPTPEQSSPGNDATTAEQSSLANDVTTANTSNFTDEKKEDEAPPPPPVLVKPAAPTPEKTATDADDLHVLGEYSVRREIATKVLGAKMLQGFSLKEVQCDKCSMPLMEKQGTVSCVVCPALAKKARKKIKEQQRIAAEKERLEREIELAKERKAADARAAAEEKIAERLAEEAEKMAIEAEQKQQEEYRIHLGEERLRQEAAHLKAQQDAIEEKERNEALQAEQLARIAFLEGEERRLLAEARAEAELEEEAIPDDEEPYFDQNISQQQTEDTATERAEAEERRQEELRLLEETRRLEKMEQKRVVRNHQPRSPEALLQEEMQRRGGKRSAIDAVQEMEEFRRKEELDATLKADLARAEDETRLIAALEAEAEAKAKMAEDAIAKARAALNTVSSARKDIIAQTIAEAEREAVMEAEDFIRAVREDYKQPVLEPSPSILQQERWEVLRAEGRAVMTRRIIGGWRPLAEFCKGAECEGCALLEKGVKRECVVCGGSGSGKDGVYEAVEEPEPEPGSPVDDATNTGRMEGSVWKMSDEPFVPANRSITEGISADKAEHVKTARTGNSEVDVHANFEMKRNMVSKEISDKMMNGWTLLDMSCGICSMPLMEDTEGNSDICVLCPMLRMIAPNNHEEKSLTATIAESIGESITKDIHHSNGSSNQQISRDNIDGDNGEQAVVDSDSPEKQEESANVVPETKFSFYSAESVPVVDDANEESVSSKEKGDITVKTSISDGQASSKEGTVTTETPSLQHMIRQQTERSQVAPRSSPKGDPPEGSKPKARSRAQVEPEDSEDFKTKGTHSSTNDAEEDDAVPEAESTTALSVSPSAESVEYRRAPTPTKFKFSDAETCAAQNRTSSTPGLDKVAGSSNEPAGDSMVWKRKDPVSEFSSPHANPTHESQDYDDAAAAAVAAAEQVLSEAKAGKSPPMPEFHPTRDSANRRLSPPSTSNNLARYDKIRSKASITDNFFKSVHGLTALELLNAGNVDAVQDLAESFVIQEFGDDLPSPTAGKEIAADLVVQVAAKGYREKLQSMPIDREPRQETSIQNAPTFASTHATQEESMYSDEDQPPSPRRPKVTPETMNFARSNRQSNSRGPPPSPDRLNMSARPPTPAAASPSGLPPKNPNSASPRKALRSNPRRSPRKRSPKNEFVVVGGPGEFDHEYSQYNNSLDDDDVSRAETVASQALDSILNRIETAKESLFDPNADVKKQGETARLIEQLASAAIAMKKLESL